MPEDAAFRQLLLLKEILPLVRVLPCGRKASNTTKERRFGISGIPTLKMNNNQ